MKNKYISVGKILNFHGIQGDAKVGYSKNQEDFLQSLDSVFVEKNGEYVELKIERFKFSAKFAIIKFVGINSINEISEYKNALLFVKEQTIRENLDEDEFLIDELVGLGVYVNEKKVGVVIGVSNNGATDMLSVRTNPKNVSLVPFVKAIVPEVNIKEKKVVLSDIEGLLD